MTTKRSDIVKTIQVSELTDEHLALVCQISSDPGVLKEARRRWGDEGAEKVNNLVFDYYAKEIGRNMSEDTKAYLKKVRRYVYSAYLL